MNFGEAWRLSPSDLVFLFEDCRRCYWLKVAGGMPRPRTPFPGIFVALDAVTKAFFVGKRTETLAPGIKPGRIKFGERMVRSAPIRVPGQSRPVLITGRFDTAFAYDDGTFGLADFKTSDPRSEHVRLYARQLHSYMMAAERPAPGSLELRPVSQMGLWIVKPTRMTRGKANVSFTAQPHWIELPRDDRWFLNFLAEVVDVLERPIPPEPTEGCTFCEYLMNGALSLMTGIYRAR